MAKGSLVMSMVGLVMSKLVLDNGLVMARVGLVMLW